LKEQEEKIEERAALSWQTCQNPARFRFGCIALGGKGLRE
jgi:hypothetical protein